VLVQGKHDADAHPLNTFSATDSEEDMSSADDNSAHNEEHNEDVVFMPPSVVAAQSYSLVEGAGQAPHAEDRRLSQSSVHDVPHLLGQIQVTHNLHLRPPAMDRVRSDKDLDALASQVISEMDRSKKFVEESAGARGHDDWATLRVEQRSSVDVAVGHSAAGHTEADSPAQAVSPRSRRAFVLQSKQHQPSDKRQQPPPALLARRTPAPAVSRDVHSVESDSEQASDDDENSAQGSTAEHEDEESEERAALRGDFMKKFQASRFAGLPDRKIELREKLDAVVRQSKVLAKRAMLQETLELVDPYSELNGRQKVPTKVDMSRVIEAMETRATHRSNASRTLITDMLRGGCGLSPYLTQCGAQDLRDLSDLTELRVMRPAQEEAEPLHVRGEPILKIYIVLEGQLEVTEYPAATAKSAGTAQYQGKATTTLVGHPRWVGPGECLGENVLQGEVAWRIDVAMPASAVTLCCLPLDEVLRYIGRRGADVEGVLVLFWKHHRLWQEIKQHSQELLRHSKYSQQVNGSSAKMRQQLQFKFKPMNVIDSGRIKVYQPGMEVFAQGRPREYLYLVLRGCCEYRRVFPKYLVTEGLMPLSVEVGLSLMCGDFSFMDGEDHLWLEKMQGRDEKVTRTVEDSERMKEHRRQKYVRFETHKNSLVAVSRAEVALVPIAEIAKCMKLFVRLIKLATELYPAPFVGDEDLVRRHYEEVKWQAERGEVLRQVIQDREDRMLNEQYHQDIASNVSDAVYRHHVPGYRVGKLQASLESAAATTRAALAERARSSAEGSKEAAREHERRLAQAAEDLHTPRRALMDQYFSSIGKPNTDLLAAMESGKWSFSGSEKVMPSRQSAKSHSKAGPAVNYVPVVLRPSQHSVTPRAGSGADQGRALSPPIACRPGSAGHIQHSPVTPQRPKSAQPTKQFRSPRPHSAADAQRGTKSTEAAAPRPQSSHALRTHLAPSRPGSAPATNSTRSARPHGCPEVPSGPADTRQAVSVRRGGVRAQHNFQFVVDAAFLAEMNGGSPVTQLNRVGGSAGERLSPESAAQRAPSPATDTVRFSPVSPTRPVSGQLRPRSAGPSPSHSMPAKLQTIDPEYFVQVTHCK
jgi:CRP-like cAMP-binding protein